VNPETRTPPDPEVLVQLIDRLNSYPIGLPDSPEIREFLSIFLTQDEAVLASKFPLREATAAELAKRARVSEEKALQTLEGMAEKGTVIDFMIEGEHFWFLSPSVVGFVEFSLMKLHKGMPMRRLAELLERYSENTLWKEVFGSKTPPMRALVGEGIPVTSRVMTYAQVEKVVRDAGRGAFQVCYCRHKEHLLGRECKLASYDGTCICLGMAADFMVRRGFGRAAGVEEILAKIRELGKKGLIHITDNVRDKASFVCNCCGCCCGILSSINRLNLPNACAPTPFILAVDAQKCAACGACAKLCQIRAVGLRGEKAEVTESKCLGCGTCIKACKKGALSLKDRRNPPKTPKDTGAKFVKIAWEKGRLLPLLRGGLRSKMGKLA
jgi:ferredoxin